MDLITVVTILATIITIIMTLLTIIGAALGTILGLILGVFVYIQFAPVLNIEVKSDLIKIGLENKLFLKLKFVVENKSKVLFRIDKSEVQILEYLPSTIDYLSNWVPFEKNRWNPSEIPSVWNEPKNVFERYHAPNELIESLKLFPGEILSAERLYKTQSNKILHIGFQVKKNLKWYERILTLHFRRNENIWRQTTTIIVNT